MADFPALPLWTDAYIADTAHLTNEEHGVYLRLLMFAWRTPDCALPDDDKRLAIMVGVSPRKWAALRPVLVQFWTVKDGSWTQKRLQSERDFVKRQSEAGRAGAEARWRGKSLKKKDTGDATAYAKPMRSVCDLDAPTPTPIEEKEEPKGSSKKKGSRLPEDWVLPKAWGEWAVSKGLSEASIRGQADRFRNYWCSKAGKDATKLDWFMTWKNWCLKVLEQRPNAASRKNPQIGDQITTPDGRVMEWSGIDGWMEVRW